MVGDQQPGQPLGERDARLAATSRPATLRANSRAVAAGTTRIALTSRAPTASSAAIAAIATTTSRTASAKRDAKRRGEPCAELVEAGDDPVAAERCRGDDGSQQGGAGDEELAAADREQRAEQELVDAGTGLEDVAGEDDADRQRGDEQQRRGGVAGDAGPAAEPLEQGGEAAADRERRERRRDSGGPGDDEAGEGGGADAVGEEGEVAEHDLRSEQPAIGASRAISRAARCMNGSWKGSSMRTIIFIGR